MSLDFKLTRIIRRVIIFNITAFIITISIIIVIVVVGGGGIVGIGNKLLFELFY